MPGGRLQAQGTSCRVKGGRNAARRWRKGTKMEPRAFEIEICTASLQCSPCRSGKRLGQSERGVMDEWN